MLCTEGLLNKPQSGVTESMKNCANTQCAKSSPNLRLQACRCAITKQTWNPGTTAVHLDVAPICRVVQRCATVVGNTFIPKGESTCLTSLKACCSNTRHFSRCAYDITTSTCSLTIPMVVVALGYVTIGVAITIAQPSCVTPIGTSVTITTIKVTVHNVAIGVAIQIAQPS